MQKPDAVLIDDDTLVHMTWSLMAKERKKELRVFGQAKDFLAEAADYDKATPIYVDSDLGSGVRGEAVTRQLSEQGFTVLYITSGYEASSFPAMAWLKGVIGKEPPWL